MRYEHDAMANIAALPELRKNTQVHYEGSIDKLGGNADWDWWLYQDARGEWVLFETFGPGCLYNFVQHRYLSSTDPLFRFYFDGEDEPRFELHASEFGLKYPFVDPVAGRYIGPVDFGRGPIRVIRSFVPMPFAKSLKITSDIKLEGFDRAKGHGGWGHVMWHSYAEDPGLKTFEISDDYTAVIDTTKRTGSDPMPDSAREAARLFDCAIAPGESVALLNQSGEGAVRSVKLKIRDFTPELLGNVWIRAHWDGHEADDVCVPIGCFFGNELGEHDARYLLLGMNTCGEMYNYFPMPFWEKAEIALENRGAATIALDFAEVRWLKNPGYEQANCGYFRSSDYYPRTHTEGADSIIARLKGQGHVVAAIITAHGERNGLVTCEGDVRVYIDGILTPQVESDGSESFSCYGWGFPTPPECNPFSGYDGKPDSPWSMVRTMPGDCFPFRDSLVFGIESGGCNDQYLEHSGAVFYYGKSEPSMRLTDKINLRDESCRAAHALEGILVGESVTSYYEGDDDDVEISDATYFSDGAFEFSCAIDPANCGIRLRRRSDQKHGRQAAKIFVDGEPVAERIWYFADRNVCKRWLDDEFEIGPRYTQGKASVRIRVEPTDMGNGITWNQTGYQIYSLLNK